MDPIHTTLEFLARLPLYESEKPYVATHDQADHVAKLDTQNIEWAEHPVLIRDMRKAHDIGLEKSGFEYCTNNSQHIPIKRPDQAHQYGREIEKFLMDKLSAVAVVTYNVKLRYCGEYDGEEFVDLRDVMMREGPPNGAHGSYSPFASSTWRSMLPKLEHRPLAVCDYRTVDPADLVATDRVYPHRVIELYNLHHNPDQRWYWCSHQSSEELLLMMTYDTHGEGNARFCPHVSFHNPKAPIDALPRESIETRSIVVTYESGAGEV